MPYHTYLRMTERVNLLPCWPGEGHGEKGDAFPLEEATAAAHAMVEDGVLKDRRVIMLGQNVAKVFGVVKQQPLVWSRYKWPVSQRVIITSFEADVAIIPHPSGIVRWWNDPVNRVSAGQFLRLALLEDAA